MSPPVRHPLELPLDELLRDCDVKRQRRSGPGGQHRNKVETAIIIVHRPTSIRAEATEHREQERNRQQAIFRLRSKLACQVRSQLSLDGALAQVWRGRLKNQRISINAKHDDFPVVLAHALNAIDEHEYDVPAAARELGVSTSQLIKLLKQEPHAWTNVNRSREAQGLNKLQ